MDRNLHTDDFERLLREKSDEFMMYPSKRIWYSIYNNIHPGNKWPSVAMCITLISSLLLIGYLNTRNANQYSGVIKNKFQPETAVNNSSSVAIVATAIDITPKNTVVYPTTKILTADGKIGTASLTTKASADQRLVKKTSSTSTFSLPINLLRKSVDSIAVNNLNSQKENSKANNTIIDPIANPHEEQAIYAEISKTPITIPQDFTTDNFNIEPRSNLNHPFSDFSIEQLVTQNNEDKKIGIREIAPEFRELMLGDNKKELLSSGDKEWIENYALYNRPAPKKWANKLDMYLYATPSVVYRTLYDDTNFGNTLNATPFAISASNRDLNASVNQTPSFGIELGTGLQYGIFKGVKIKTSLQLNYTRYNSHAFQNSHPVVTKLTMHNFETKTAYEVFRSTAYSNNSGLEVANLHNETFQISLPMGLDIKLLGNEHLEWNVGATIQPTFVAGAKSYLISSDRHNYVKETSMLNRWNLNAGFETFIAYKVNGLTWQIGPQFRKQLFSTNSKTYAVEERLVNYGLKIGVTKTIK